MSLKVRRLIKNQPQLKAARRGHDHAVNQTWFVTLAFIFAGVFYFFGYYYFWARDGAF